LASAAFAYFLYLSTRGGEPGQYLVVAGVAVLLQLNIFHFARLYRFDLLSNPVYQIGRLTAGWSALFFILLAAAFLTKTSDQYSRGWVLIWYSSGLAALVMLRVGLYLRIRRWTAEGRLTRNLAIVGAGEHGGRLLWHLGEQLGTDFRVVGLFDDRAAQGSRVPEILEGHAHAGSVDDLLGFARENRVDQVIIALPWSAEERLLEIMYKLRTLPVDVRLGADMIGYHLFQSSFGHVGSVPVINLFQKPLSDWKLLAKDIEDRVLGAAISLFIAPLMIVIALLVKLDSPGPVFFRQKRYGFNNQEIVVWKFRTMRPEAALDAASPQARRNDPRITPFGRFLRRSSLDELPQIFNVLRGDMSLVGPRPHAVQHNEQYAQVINEYAARHRVKPGITGWAQVNGWRGETDTVDKMQKRVEHDIHYIDNWSIGFDLKILAMTAFVVLRGDNAY
jgi:Undecaprenyl-phosphate glucose phosphotransferase